MRATVLILALLGFVSLAQSAQASTLERIISEAEFVAAVSDRSITRFGVSLTVSAEGRITGRGMGVPVTGAWEWRDGYFCRTLAWGGDDLGHNCQAVMRDGDRVRFQSDRGTGDYADFRLR